MPSPRSLQRANTLNGADRQWYEKLINGRPRRRNPPIETWTLIHDGLAGTPTTNCQVPNFLSLYGYDIRVPCQDMSGNRGTP